MITLKESNVLCNVSTRLTMLFILLSISLFLGTPGEARLIFDTTDPVFTDRTVVVPLDATIGLTDGMQSFQTIQNGVTFDFSTQSPSGFFADGDGFITPVEGVVISINPAVSAIGFQFVRAECPATATFTGAAGSETFTTEQGDRNLFIGAADIGDISSVTLSESCYVAVWSAMHFVPSTGGPPPDDEADLSSTKHILPLSLDVLSQADSPVTYSAVATNLGPDTAIGTQIVDFLPPGTTLLNSTPDATLTADETVATITLGDLNNGDSEAASLEMELPPFVDLLGGPTFSCESALLNVALTTSSSLETDSANNLSRAVNFFDKSSRSGFAEICMNGIDDDCDGDVDCFDSECQSFCSPPMASVGAPDICNWLYPPRPQDLDTFLGNCVSPGPGTTPRERDGVNQECTFYDFHGDPHEIPSYCCDPQALAERALHSDLQVNADCRLGVPVDPNFKESVPPVNVQGYGYTEAGQTMTYTLQYENIGTADAHDVSILDVLDEDLDDSTLVIHDGGTYDSADRVLLWNDPVVPPGTPRTVSFSVNVYTSAAPGTRIRNIGTIIFPDAVPPSRIDTNFVEHVVVDPYFPVIENLKVFQCAETSPGSNEWFVDLVNEGFGFAYNVTATIIDPPASVQVTDGTASFDHPHNALSTPPAPTTVVPLASTTSTDTVAFTTLTPEDPCGALTWRIQYQKTPDGQPLGIDVQDAPDADADAVADVRDNCPGVYNPDQADTDNDSIGDICEQGRVSVDKTQDFVDRGGNSVFLGDTISYTIEFTNFFEQTLDVMIHEAISAYVDYVAGTLQGPVGDSFLSGMWLDFTLEQGETLAIAFDVQVRADALLNDFIFNTATVSYVDPISGDSVEDSDTVQVRVGEIPEPATLVFFGVGLFALLVFVRRTLRKS